MKKFLGLIIILTILLLSACNIVINSSESVRGTGNIVSETRSISNVKGVLLTMPGDLEIVLGDTESLVIEAEDNLLPYIESRVALGILTIGTKPGASINSTRPMHFTLTVKNMESITNTSSGNISAPQLQTTRFSVKISSSGDVSLEGLTADTIQVQISSSGNLNIAGGQAGDQNITISSSGNYEAGDLQSKTATVRMSSSGEATIWVTDRLDGSISSSGEVKYYGSPQVNIRTSSSGNAVALGSK